MDYSFDIWEAIIRIIKYAFEGLIVALVAFILPQSKLRWSEIWLIGLTAAAVFSILDLLAPSISAGTKQGVGMGTGFRLVGFPA